MAHAESSRANPSALHRQHGRFERAESCIFEIQPGRRQNPSHGGRHQCCSPGPRTLGAHRKTPKPVKPPWLHESSEKTQATPDGVIGFLKDHNNGISHRGSGRSPTNDGTYQSLVFDIANHRIFVADGTTLPVSLSGAYREIAVDV
jgi:hypothetical protein